MKSPRFWRVWILIAGALSIACVCDASTAGRTPLQIVQSKTANYPPALLMEGVSSGEVWMLITVDDTGTLTDSMITRSTHRGFASEALRAVRSWKYTAARIDSRPVSVRTEIRLNFESKGHVLTLDAASTVQQLTGYAGRRDYVNHLCDPAELDRPLAALHTVSPPHPGNAADGTLTGGRAVLDFIIDENGIARMPVVVSSTNEDFATAATLALEQWRFTPPVRRGRPVAVQARQEFVFSRETDSTTAGAPAKRLSSARPEGRSLAL